MTPRKARRQLSGWQSRVVAGVTAVGVVEDPFDVDTVLLVVNFALSMELEADALPDVNFELETVEFEKVEV